MGVCGDKILLLDDEDGFRFLLTEELRIVGYDVHDLSSKAEGLAWILKHKPDLVITDIGSPDLNGLEFLRLLRANPAICHTRVIMVTGHDDLSDAIEAKKYGALDYVTKPCMLQDLLERIKPVFSN